MMPSPSQLARLPQPILSLRGQAELDTRRDFVHRHDLAYEYVEDHRALDRLCWGLALLGLWHRRRH